MTDLDAPDGRLARRRRWRRWGVLSALALLVALGATLGETGPTRIAALASWCTATLVLGLLAVLEEELARRPATGWQGAAWDLAPLAAAGAGLTTALLFQPAYVEAIARSGSLEAGWAALGKALRAQLRGGGCLLMHDVATPLALIVAILPLSFHTAARGGRRVKAVLLQTGGALAALVAVQAASSRWNVIPALWLTVVSGAVWAGALGGSTLLRGRRAGARPGRGE